MAPGTAGEGTKARLEHCLTVEDLLHKAPVEALEKALTAEVEAEEERALHIDALDVAAPKDWSDSEAEEQLKRFYAAAAFLYSCAISREQITAFAPRDGLSDSEFASFMAGHLGLLPPLLRHAVGKEIRAPTGQAVDKAAVVYAQVCEGGRYRGW